MNLVWKLLRQHISVPQLAGFFFANLFGMFIVLMGYQFYRDVVPVFTAKDTFMKADFMVISKKIGTATTISGQSNTFNGAEIDDISAQPFVKSVGAFTPADFRVNASMAVQGQPLLSSEIFLESVPDDFIDIQVGDWSYKEGAKEVPIILPRWAIDVYKFGLA